MKNLWASLNPPNRLRIGFCFWTVLPYVLVAALLLAYLFPPLLRPYLGTHSAIVSITAAWTLLGLWLLSSITLLSWRLSGYLYSMATDSLRSSPKVVAEFSSRLLPKVQTRFRTWLQYLPTLKSRAKEHS